MSLEEKNVKYFKDTKNVIHLWINQVLCSITDCFLESLYKVFVQKFWERMLAVLDVVCDTRNIVIRALT